MKEMTEKRYSAITRAHNLGTYNAMDRAAQYQAVEQDEMLRSLNEAWTTIRNLQREGGNKDAEILKLKHRVSSYKIANIALTSIITGLAWEGIRFLLPFLARIFN